MSRTYPFTAYVLTPSMVVKKIDLVRMGFFSVWRETERGSSFHDDHLYDTPQAAIASGRYALEEQRAKLAKQQENIEKRAANPDKAEGGL